MEISFMHSYPETAAVEGMNPRQSALTTRTEKSMGEISSQINFQSGAGPSDENITTVSPPSRRMAIRQKTDSSLPDEVEMDLNFNDLTTPSYLRRSSSMPSVSDAIIKPVLKHYDYNSRLNRLQKRFLRFTWHRLQTKNGGKRIENVFEEVYERLLRQLPGTWEMFTTQTFLSAMSRSETATLRDHAKETVKLIDYAIKNLEASDKERNDTGSDYDPFLLGKAHGKLRPYGFTGNYWEKLGEIIVDVVLVQEAVRDLPGAGQAWVIFTACLVDQLRAGFDESKSGLTPRLDTAGMLSQKFICSTIAELGNSENAGYRHQHAYLPTDTACYSSVNHCYIGRSIPPKYASIAVTSKRNPSPIFDSDMLQKDGERNYALPEYNSSTFQSRRRNSTRIMEDKKYFRSLYSSNYPRNLSSVYENSSNTQVLNPKSIVKLRNDIYKS
ncbi:hypothetical protein DINM_006412 [Dirofilaria immitis]|nr:hypothetical protein [Dirofilaria immitis]